MLSNCNALPEAKENHSAVELKRLLTLSTLLCLSFFAMRAPVRASSFTPAIDNIPAEDELEGSLGRVYEQLTENLLFGQRHAGRGAGGTLGMVLRP
jgi:hypothetical protein